MYEIETDDIKEFCRKWCAVGKGKYGVRKNWVWRHL
jgi:hypothetical protein